VHFISVLGIAVALAMDAFAVAIATGVSLKRVNCRQTFRLSWHFGFFQALMPVIGWSAGLSIRSSIEAYDHWLAFGMLAFVGGRMIKEAFGDEKGQGPTSDPTKGYSLVLLSLATSVDALAVGFSISVLNVAIWTPAAIIGIVAAAFTVFGLYLGKKAASGMLVSRYAEVVGGIILVAIGVNILREHGALFVL
jgi:putative Mn2+ efflux pump MntP